MKKQVPNQFLIPKAPPGRGPNAAALLGSGIPPVIQPKTGIPAIKPHDRIAQRRQALLNNSKPFDSKALIAKNGLAPIQAKINSRFPLFNSINQKVPLIRVQTQSRGGLPIASVTQRIQMKPDVMSNSSSSFRKKALPQNLPQNRFALFPYSKPKVIQEKRVFTSGLKFDIAGKTEQKSHPIYSHSQPWRPPFKTNVAYGSVIQAAKSTKTSTRKKSSSQKETKEQKKARIKKEREQIKKRTVMYQKKTKKLRRALILHRNMGRAYEAVQEDYDQSQEAKQNIRKVERVKKYDRKVRILRGTHRWKQMRALLSAKKANRNLNIDGQRVEINATDKSGRAKPPQVFVHMGADSAYYPQSKKRKRTASSTGDELLSHLESERNPQASGGQYLSDELYQRDIITPRQRFSATSPFAAMTPTGATRPTNYLRVQQTSASLNVLDESVQQIPDQLLGERVPKRKRGSHRRTTPKKIETALDEYESVVEKGGSKKKKKAAKKQVRRELIRLDRSFMGVDMDSDVDVSSDEEPDVDSFARKRRRVTKPKPVSKKGVSSASKAKQTSKKKGHPATVSSSGKQTLKRKTRPSKKKSSKKSK